MNSQGRSGKISEIFAVVLAEAKSNRYTDSLSTAFISLIEQKSSSTKYLRKKKKKNTYYAKSSLENTQGKNGTQLIYKTAAAAAKSLQSCPTLYDPIDGSPSGSPIPGIFQARTLEWVAISFSDL